MELIRLSENLTHIHTYNYTYMYETYKVSLFCENNAELKLQIRKLNKLLVQDEDRCGFENMAILLPKNTS
jgi:hypothetical protein